MATVSFRMDDATKQKFERLCDDLGMSMSTAVNVFVKKAVREQRIPFEINSDPFYSKENVKYLEQIVREHEEGKAVWHEHELVEVDE